MDKEIQIILKKLAEIIYEQFIKDLENRKLNIYLKKLKPVQAVRNLTKKD